MLSGCYFGSGVVRGTHCGGAHQRKQLDQWNNECTDPQIPISDTLNLQNQRYVPTAKILLLCVAGTWVHGPPS